LNKFFFKKKEEEEEDEYVSYVKMSITMKNGIHIPFTRPEIHIPVHRKISPKYPFKPVAGHAHVKTLRIKMILQKWRIHPTTQSYLVLLISIFNKLSTLLTSISYIYF